MAKLYNLARMTTATTGTGAITLGSAVSGYLSFALAGVANGEVVSYGIKDGANSEVGTGTYTSAGTTLTRTVTKSTNSDTAISLSGSAEVYITARKEDIANLGENNTFAGQMQFPDANGIYDDSGNEQLLFQKTASAVNYLEITNADTGNDPSLVATGSDTDVSLLLAAQGAGIVLAVSELAVYLDADAEVRGLWLVNASTGTTSQTNLQMQSGTAAQFQFSAYHNGAGCDWYVNKGDTRIIVAEADKVFKLNVGDTGPDNIRCEDSKDLWLNDMLRRQVALASDHTLASATGTEVTDLQFVGLGVGTFVITYYLVVQSSATGTGIGTGINFTGTATMAALRREATTGTTTASGVIDDVSNAGTGQLYEARANTAFSTTSPNMLNTGGFATANANCLVVIEVWLNVTASGDLELWHSSETANNTSIMTGSYAELRQVA